MSGRSVPRNWHRGPAGLKVAEALEQLEHLQQREAQLIEQLRLLLHGALQAPEESDLSPEKDFAWNCQQVGNELAGIDGLKTSAINVLKHADQCESIELVLSTQSFLSVVQQPPPVAVANRYLLPAPTVTVVLPPRFSMDADRTFVVRAQLAYSNSDAPLQLTLDGKQDVLQGVTLVPIDKHRRAIFQKLKIMEVSSKHQHRYFSLVFRLIECHHGNQIQHPTEVRSSGFQVQSRPHKRKRGADSPPIPSIFPLTSSSQTVRKTFSLPDSSVPQPRSLLESYSSVPYGTPPESAAGRSMQQGKSMFPAGSTSGQSSFAHPSLQQMGLRSHHSSSSSDSSSSPPSSDSEVPDTTLASTSSSSTSAGYPFTSIDVSHVLACELEVAAERLNVSPKTLERRYREATHRQWPARKLRKIENYLSREHVDQQKLQMLVAKRKQITQHSILHFRPYDFLTANTMSSGSAVPTASVPSAQTLSAPLKYPIPRGAAPSGYGSPSWLPSFARVGGQHILLPSLAGLPPPSSTPPAPQYIVSGQHISATSATTSSSVSPVEAERYDPSKLIAPSSKPSTAT